MDSINNVTIEKEFQNLSLDDLRKFFLKLININIKNKQILNVRQFNLKSKIFKMRLAIWLLIIIEHMRLLVELLNIVKKW